MEGEINNYIKVWLQVAISLCYCYAIGKIVPKGVPTLLAILPILCLFLSLPLHLHTVHLGGTLAFFISWLANFKLLLFSFGKGPLSDPSLSLKQFLAVASFPIKIQYQNTHPKTTHKTQNGTTISEKSQKMEPQMKTGNKGQKSLLNYAIKGLIFAGVLRAYAYRDHIHPETLLHGLYCLHIYLSLEIILAMVAAMARTLLGIELEPQFDEPYLSSSLQDFWGRRWNIVVSNILRPTVYKPTQVVAVRLIGPEWASLVAVMVTFLVSGLMHELIFYYLGRVRPTWEITWFFLLHGFCLDLEIVFKKKLTARFRLPRVVSGPITVGFVMVTAFWLFLPQLLRCNGDKRALQEYAAVGAFVKNATRILTFSFDEFRSRRW